MRGKLAATLGAGVIVLAGAVGTAAQEEPVELTMLADVNDQLTAELWTGLFDRFTEEHPNITVSLVPTPSGDRETRARTLLASGDFPDVHFPLPTVTFKDELLPFDLEDPEIANQILNVDKLLVDGQLLGLGIDSQPWNTIFYNKTMFEEAGITEEPTTFEEFEEIVAKLKEAGFAPILGAGEWVPHFTFMATNDIFAQTPCWLGAREAGEVSFSDPEWVEAAQRFASWVQNGYFNEGPLGLGYTQANDFFLQGGAAMYPIGSWLTGLVAAQPPEFEVGYFAMPNRDGDLKLVGSIGSTGFTVSRTTEHPEEAVTLAKWLAFDEGSISTLLNALGFQSNIQLESGPMEELAQTPLGQEVADDILATSTYNTAWNGQGDCAQRPDAQIAIGTLVAEPLYLDPAQPVEPLLASLDQFWEDAQPAQ
jgi:ABC-type glycerol-3-phosphate transport system substrate-binding protein